MALALFGCTTNQRNLPQVTVPNGSTPAEANTPHAPMNDDLRYIAWNYGNGALWVYIPKDGIFTISDDDRDADGYYRLKIGWWRGVRGQLTIVGERLDTPSTPLHYNAGSIEEYGDTGFVPSVLSMPGQGLWEITGDIADKSLTIIIRVVKNNK